MKTMDLPYGKMSPELTLSFVDLTKEFLAQPQPVIDELIASKRLKGNVLSCIRKAIIGNSSRPDLAKLLWIVFSPRILSVILTEGRCNLACRMCGGSRGALKSLAVSDLRTILEHVPTTELITFVAGNSEPLLHPDIRGILDVLHQFRVNADIVTNGHLLTDSLADVMVEFGLPTSLNISLDAASEMRYRSIRGASLNSVIQKLKRLNKRKQSAGMQYPRLALLMVGMADNIGELAALVDIAADTGAFRVHLDHMKGDYPPGDFTTNPDWPLYIEQAQMRASNTNVILQLPSDILAGAASLGGNSTTTEKSPSHRPTLSCCSWVDSTYVGLDGCMMPCCHNCRTLGNILERHIAQQQCYFRYRMKNVDGYVEAFCTTARNCAYSQEQRALGLKPSLMGAMEI
jgi:hypothetical protein